MKINDCGHVLTFNLQNYASVLWAIVWQHLTCNIQEGRWLKGRAQQDISHPLDSYKAFLCGFPSKVVQLLTGKLSTKSECFQRQEGGAARLVRFRFRK